MPSQFDSSTPTRWVLNPLLVYINDRQVGPTRGGVTISITPEIVQPEMDGVNQMIVGASYKRSESVEVSFSLVEFSENNMQLGVNNVAPTGTAPNVTLTPFGNMSLMQAGQFMGAPGLRMYGKFTDPTTAGYWFFFMPNGLITASFAPGASGEMTMAYSIKSAAPAATPDASVYTYGRVAALPSEVGGP